MSDVPSPTDAPHTVSSLSAALRRCVEGAFAHVRVRGEIAGFKAAASGHLYMTLRDENASLDVVCWRGQAVRLGARPADGLEVIATGRLTTYPGRSKYQLLLEALEPAGEGALLKLLEARRRQLAAEGLFDAARKRPLPRLPAVIGVVTSPTGAVIRDILHRLAERFPCRVLLWPVAVQGETAAAQVAAALRGFAALPPGGAVPRPELLLVARGGGALEDLWPFNEEEVVRAVAACGIPVVSAIGHETDHTLIDLAADLRAPTPTAAAELAVPVRAELLSALRELDRRALAAADRRLREQARHLQALARGLPRPAALLQTAAQRLDDLGERLRAADMAVLRNAALRLRGAAARLRPPTALTARAAERLQALRARLTLSLRQTGRRDAARLTALGPDVRLRAGLNAAVRRAARELEQTGARLYASSHRNVLRRGFAIITGAEGGYLTSRSAAIPGAAVRLHFHDGAAAALLTPPDSGAAEPSSGGGKKTAAAGRSPAAKGEQGRLL